MTINDAIVVIDELCGERGTFSIAWKMIRARLYEEVQNLSQTRQGEIVAVIDDAIETMESVRCIIAVNWQASDCALVERLLLESIHRLNALKASPNSGGE